MTFLFAFATTSVIVVVTIGVLWVPRDEIEVRFSKAKDIMTILISVLGTILGFYFGQHKHKMDHRGATRCDRCRRRGDQRETRLCGWGSAGAYRSGRTRWGGSARRRDAAARKASNARRDGCAPEAVTEARA